MLGKIAMSEKPEAPAGETGVVKWFSIDRGYGFIIPDRQLGEDVFVHITSVHRSGLHSLEKDAKVRFEIKMNKGRPTAINIKLNGK